jgi:hypothetical protein
MSRADFQKRIERLTNGYEQRFGGIEPHDRIATMRQVIQAERDVLQHLRSMRAQPQAIRAHNLGSTRVFDDMALDLRIRESEQRILGMCQELSEIT